MYFAYCKWKEIMCTESVLSSKIIKIVNLIIVTAISYEKYYMKILFEILKGLWSLQIRYKNLLHNVRLRIQESDKID